MPRRSDLRIKREEVIGAALDLLDKGGLDALTLRRVADELNIQAPSLYWHFPDKQALLDGMADTIIGEVVLPPVRRGQDWSRRFRAIAFAIRKALLARRDGARVYAGTYVPTENVLRVAEACIASLREAGVSARLATDGVFTMLDFTLAFVIEEQAIDPRKGGPSDLARRGKKLRQLAQQAYPNVLAALPRLTESKPESRFAAGVDLLIAGIRAQLPAERQRRKRRNATT